MRIGPLDQRVTLQTRSAARDAVGQNDLTWNDVATVWAQRINQRSVEAVQATQVGEDEVIEFHIRYRSDVQITWRLVWKGAGYDIIGVSDFGGRRDRTRILCKKGIKDGR